jgi:hypothetical protein
MARGGSKTKAADASSGSPPTPSPAWIKRRKDHESRIALAAKPSPRPAMSARLERDLSAEVFYSSVKQARATKPKLPPCERWWTDTWEGELARLDASPEQPCRWHSPLRLELARHGLVEIVTGEDGKWLGDRITMAGRSRIASPKAATRSSS